MFSRNPNTCHVRLTGLDMERRVLILMERAEPPEAAFPPRRPGAGPSRLVATAARSIRSRIADQSRRPGGAVIFQMDAHRCIAVDSRLSRRSGCDKVTYIAMVVGFVGIVGSYKLANSDTMYWSGLVHT